MCYNIFGIIVGFHPISRVKLLFGVAFFIFRIKSSCLILCNIFIIPDLSNIWYYAVCEFVTLIFDGRKICYNISES
ncbi:hypothetical protein [Lactococcus petauri]|uniref:hypothetical protein n=1 Tax=Lactococcus petauri TaxID=1940789 RepID=UPI00359C76E8